MKKTYWWRWGVVGVSFLGVIVSYFFGHKIGFNVPYQETPFCIFFPCLEATSSSIGKPLFLFPLFLLAVSPFLFFVRDKVFLSWLRFALVWSMLTAIAVALAPVSQGGWLGIGPEKWSVTMAMGWIFLVASLILLVWKSLREKKNTPPTT